MASRSLCAWGISFPIDACLVMTLVAVCGVVEILGTTSATVDTAANRPATLEETRKTVLTQAVTSVFAGIFNAVPTISGSAVSSASWASRRCSPDTPLRALASSFF